MDHDTVVSEQTESGKQLIEALVPAGFDVRVAFWAIRPANTSAYGESSATL